MLKNVIIVFLILTIVFSINVAYSETLQDRQKLEKDLKSVEKEIDKNPEDAKLWHVKGYILFELQRYEDAIKAMDRATEIDSNFVEAIGNIPFWFIE